MARMPARDCWSLAEILNMARALSLGMTDEQRQGAARLLLGLGLGVPEIAQAMGVQDRHAENVGGTLLGALPR